MARPRLARLRKKRPERKVYVGSYEDKLSRLPAMRITAEEEEKHTPAETVVDRMLRLGGIPRESRFKE
jgi:hypothetical protein